MTEETSLPLAENATIISTLDSTSSNLPVDSSSPWVGTLPNDLRLFRERAGLNQREAALRLNLPRNRLSLWEGGKGLPTMDELGRLANLYGVSISQLYPPSVLRLLGTVA